MSNRLFHVLDGIISDNEFGAQNLESVDSVVAYAEAAGHQITDKEAERIIAVGKRWLHEQERGNGEWDRMRREAEAALDTEDGASKISYRGQEFDMAAARNLMDDEICEQIHGTVETDQEFVEAYAAAHEAKFGTPFVIN